MYLLIFLLLIITGNIIRFNFFLARRGRRRKKLKGY